MIALSVLLVDESAHVRQIMRAILGELGSIEVYEFSEGTAALDGAKDLQPDIAIIDCEMQPTDGFRFAEMIRAGATPLSSSLPVIMMSTKADVQSVTRARNTGASGFIVKPLSVGAVRGQLERTLSANAHRTTDGRFSRLARVLAASGR